MLIVFFLELFQERRKKNAYAHVAVEVALFQFAERDPVGYSMFYNLKSLLGVELKVLILIKVLRIVPCAYWYRVEHDVVRLVVSAYDRECGQIANEMK